MRISAFRFLHFSSFGVASALPPNHVLCLHSPTPRFACRRCAIHFSLHHFSLFICVRIIFIALNPANLAKLILPFPTLPRRRSGACSPPKTLLCQQILGGFRGALCSFGAFCLRIIVRNEFRLLMRCFPFFTSFPFWPGVFAIHSRTFDSNEVREPRFRSLFLLQLASRFVGSGSPWIGTNGKPFNEKIIAETAKQKTQKATFSGNGKCCKCAPLSLRIGGSSGKREDETQHEKREKAMTRAKLFFSALLPSRRMGAVPKKELLCFSCESLPSDDFGKVSRRAGTREVESFKRLSPLERRF